MPPQSAVKNLLVHLRRPSVFPLGSHYITKVKLVHFITLPVIQQELQHQGLNPEDSGSLVEWILGSSLLLFCILVNAEGVQFISELQRGGITDSDLPFESYEYDGRISLRMASRREQSISTYLLDTRVIQAILEGQWTFLSPVFDSLGRHYDLNEQAILPIQREDNLRKTMASSWVARVQIDADTFAIPMIEREQGQAVALHRTSSQPHSTTLCAIKCLSNRRDFDAERRGLLACNLQNHLHIVTLLASFTWKGLDCLMLPCAVYDLQEFWQDEAFGKTQRQQNTAQWALRQMRGLASAIHTVHKKLTCNGKAVFGMHGDVKASNVLVFRSEPGRPGHGVLKLADFVTSSFCDKNEPPTYFSPADPVGTHQPPECFLGHERSQEFDMWGLGCLFLEFVVWLQHGWSGIDRFSQSRMQEDYGFGLKFRNDYFFKLASPQQDYCMPTRTITEVNPGVTDYVGSMRRDMHSSSPLAKLLDVIEDNLLQINPEQRCTSEQLELAFDQGSLLDIDETSIAETAGNTGHMLFRG